MEQPPQWFITHENSDAQHFAEISKEIDVFRKEMNAHMEEIKPYLEAAAAFRLGSVVLKWAGGFIIAVGTIIVLAMQIFHK